MSSYYARLFGRMLRAVHVRNNTNPHRKKQSRKYLAVHALVNFHSQHSAHNSTRMHKDSHATLESCAGRRPLCADQIAPIGKANPPSINVVLASCALVCALPPSPTKGLVDLAIFPLRTTRTHTRAHTLNIRFPFNWTLRVFALLAATSDDAVVVSNVCVFVCGVCVMYVCCRTTFIRRFGCSG